MRRYRLLTEHPREHGYDNSHDRQQLREYNHKSRSNNIEPEIYVQELREVLHDKKKNNPQTAKQHLYLYENTESHAPAYGRSVPVSVDQMRPLYVVESSPEEKRLPKLKRKSRNDNRSDFNENEKLIIRNYMNAKLVQFRKALPKIKNKTRNNTHVASIKEVESSYQTKSPANKYFIREYRENNKSIYEPKHNTNYKSIRTEPEEDLDKHSRKMPYPSYLGSRVESQNKIYNYLDGEFVPHSHLVQRSRVSLIEGEQNNLKKKESKMNDLSLETEFVKERERENYSEAIDEQGRPKLQIPDIPNKLQVSEFLDNYECECLEIDIEKLRKEPNFEILDYVEENKRCFYFGQTKKEFKHGKGVLICDKTVFEGTWKYNEKVKGIEISEIGKYKGEFEEGKREGRGEFFWSHGEYYSGEWKKGKKNGSGYWRSEKGETYIGEWANGEVNGYGVHTLEKGHKYEGEFLKFLKHGFGNETFVNGDIYEGRYEQGHPHGKGKYEWENGVIYEGFFLEGLRHGKGTLISPGLYEFEGLFKKELICGTGKLKLANGDTFKGMFENNKKNGDGVYHIKSEGIVLKGVWRDNEFIKEER